MKKIFSFLWRYKIYTIIIGIIFILIWKKNNSGQDYTYDTVTKSDITEQVSETGNLQLQGQASIISPIEGIVNQIFVNNGTYVGAGRSLFSIRSNATEIERAAAYASLLTAQSNLKVAKEANGTGQAAIDSARATYYDAQVNYHNIEQWFSHGYKSATTGRHYTQTDVDAAKASLDAAQKGVTNAEQALADTEARVMAAQSTLDSAQETYDSKNVYTVKTARAGTVYNVSVNMGDKVSPTATTPAMIIAGSKTLEFKAQINENEIAKLREGQVASITVDAVKDKAFEGLIESIDTIGTNTAGVITYNVCFSVKQGDENIRSGMSGNVDVVTNEHKNVLTVANSAIKPYQNGKAVQVVDTSKPKQGKTPALKYIPVKIGIKGVERTEITEGLTEGMQVVTNAGQNQFKSNLFGG
jgi:HlyD family secretion protein